MAEQGGPIGAFLGSSFWQPIKNLTFGVYLCHIMIIDLLYFSMGSHLTTLTTSALTFSPQSKTRADARRQLATTVLRCRGCRWVVLTVLVSVMSLQLHSRAGGNAVVLGGKAVVTLCLILMPRRR